MARYFRTQINRYDLSQVKDLSEFSGDKGLDMGSLQSYLKTLEPMDSKKAKDMYMVFGEDGEPWIEAHQFLIHKLNNSPKSILSNAKDLAHYLSFLEQEGITWLHFPKRKDQRCVYLYHEYLKDESRVSNTRATESRRMNLIISFYRWAEHEGLIDKRIKKWKDKRRSVAFYTKEGFQRSMPVLTTDLQIRVRKSNTLAVEDGLMPLHLSDRDALIQYLRESQSTTHEMLLHMFSLGFVSGARSETIRYLGVSNLKQAKDAHPFDKHHPNFVYLAVGSGTNVKTKNDVFGYLRIAKPVFDALYSYAFSPTRLERAAKAKSKGKDEDRLFLTQQGNPISENSFTGIMANFRERLVADGLTQFHDLKFHQARATCGTSLVTAILKTGTAIDAINIARDWLMHKHERTTWEYIKFVENAVWTEEISEEINAYFLGPAFTS